MKLKIVLCTLSCLCSAQAEQKLYQNPVDGVQYEADWKTYSPKQGVAGQSDRWVQIKSTRLLSTQKEFAENISVPDLAEFIKATQNNIEKNIDPGCETFELFLDTTISKDKEPGFSLASQGKVSEEQLQKIQDGLEKLKGFKSKSAELKYQLHLLIKKP